MKQTILLCLLLIGCNESSDGRNYGKSKELGHGFIKRSYTVENPPEHWEAIGHFSSTFYKGKELGMLDGFRISPSEKYAIYSKSEEGRLYIFHIPKGMEQKVIFNDYCYPSNPKWKESDNELIVTCLGEGDTKFKLSINLTSQLTTRLGASDVLPHAGY